MKVLSIRRITNDRRHNAFTGACWFKGEAISLFCGGAINEAWVCVECDVIQQVTFDAVCKIFDGEIGNTAEVSECIGGIAQLALIGVDEVCSPNETSCLSVILGNVQDLIDSK